jgi:hypothetical protein
LDTQTVIVVGTFPAGKFMKVFLSVDMEGIGGVVTE